MILTDSEILKNIEYGAIEITPFDIKNLGSNSYDVHISNTLTIYTEPILNPLKNNATINIFINEDGYLLLPGKLYLAVTNEFTYTPLHVPFLDGVSSLARLGLNIHATAGVGDIGFRNHWTLELSVIQPLMIYPNMRIGQIYFFEPKGKVKIPYDRKKGAKYNKQSQFPIPSLYYIDINQND